MLAMRASLCFRDTSPVAARLSTTFRRLRLVVAPGVLAAAATLASAPGVSAAGPTAVDCSTTDLQAAIDTAAPGATLAVKGICRGNFTIGKDLTVRGQGNAVLDGQGSGT